MLTNFDISKNDSLVMNTYQQPNNEWDSFTKVMTLLFVISIILMLGGYFEILVFENMPVFDKPLKVNIGTEDKSILHSYV